MEHRMRRWRGWSSHVDEDPAYAFEDPDLRKLIEWIAEAGQRRKEAAALCADILDDISPRRNNQHRYV